MKRKKVFHRILAAVAASVMLLSSMTAFAAPAKSDNPTWEDVISVREFIESDVYSHFDRDELWTVNEENETIELVKLTAPAGKLLISESEWEHFENGTDVPFKWENIPEDIEGEEMSDELKGLYSAWYDEIMGIVAGMETATGEYYVDEALWQQNAYLWDENITPMWDWPESGKLVIVDFNEGETAPDESQMESGTWWVSADVWRSYCERIEAVNADKDEWYQYSEEIWFPTEAQLTRENNLLQGALEFLRTNFHGKSEPEPVPEVKPEAEKKSSGKAQSAEPEEVEVVIVNQVVASDGTKSLPTIEGVYGKVCMAGVVYKDDKNKIKQSAGLTEEEVKNGVVIKSYICESLNKDMNQKLAGAASDKGWKLLGVMNNDLYKMDKGKISPVRKVNEPLTVVLGVPEKLRDSKYVFAALCYDENGNVVELQDTDADKATVTVSASNFGYWAIVYKEAASN